MASDEREFVLVTEYFHPDTASTGQLMTDLAVGLKERGLNLKVLTGQPNYHSGTNEKQPQDATYMEVPVKRIRAPQLGQTSFVRRGFNWVVFTIWMTFALVCSRPRATRELVLVSNPPFLPVALWAVCKLRGWDYTYIVYDLYPDFALETGYFEKGGVVDRIWSPLSRRTFRDAKHIVALGPAMRDRILRNSGGNLDTSKVAIIHNWEDEEFIVPRMKSENRFAQDHGLVEPFVLLYSGNIGENHDLETVVEAAAELPGTDDVVVLLIGEGDNKDETVALAEERGVFGSRVRFLPYQPLEQLPYSVTAGDVSIVSVREGLTGICVSSKLYTALAAGTPVLLIAESESDEARIVDRFDAGTNVAPGDINGVVEAIREWNSNPELLSEQRRNAREAFEAHFTKKESLDRYYSLLTSESSLSSDSLE